MNWKRFFVVMFALLVSVLATNRPVWSQATVNSGNIQGTVTDAQGGVVANATVTISNKATGSVLTLTTNGSGTYSSGTLQPAVYTVRIEATSFKALETTITVQVSQVSVYNARLEVGASTSVVEVSGESVQVNTDQAQLAGTLTTEQIENLPINGRNFLDLAQLEPGVQIQDGGSFDPTKNGYSSLSFGGRFGRTARIEVDGVDMVTVVTEGIFSYCGAKVKIDTDRHLGPERSLVRAQGETVGHVTTSEYGSQMLSIGGVRHLTGGKVNQLSQCPMRSRVYGCVSAFNSRHMMWAWISLFWVGFTDVYIRLCATGHLHDIVFFKL